jgi:Protein of unknown function (DUF2591)
MADKLVKVEIKTLAGIALDWVIAKCEGYSFTHDSINHLVEKNGRLTILGHCTTGNNKKCGYSPSTDPAQGAPIIFDSGILSGPSPFPGAEYAAGIGSEWDTATHIHLGRTQLEAGLRCFAVSKLGETVDIPEQLLASVDADTDELSEQIGEKYGG